MKERTKDIFNCLYMNFPALKGFAGEIETAFSILSESYRRGNKVLVCGNGGSAADSEHIVGELMKGFRLKRPLPDKLREKMEREFQGEHLADYLQEALPAISLTSQSALMTAFNNDVSPDTVFAQQVLGYGGCADRNHNFRKLPECNKCCESGKGAWYEYHWRYGSRGRYAGRTL